MHLTTSPFCIIMGLCLFTSLFTLTACNDNNSHADAASGYISQYQSDKNIILVNVTNMATGLKASFTDNDTDEEDYLYISDNDSRIALTQSLLTPARFFTDLSGYFFVETLADATVIEHIYTDWIGDSRYDAQDLNGKYHVQEMINTVNHMGYGFVSYYFTHPVTSQPAEKIAFVTGVDMTDTTDNIIVPEWFIGSGFYDSDKTSLLFVNDANKILAKQVTQTMANALAGVFSDIYSNDIDFIYFANTFLDPIRFYDDQSGYFFIWDSNANVEVHATSPSLEGTNVWDLTDSQGDLFVQGLLKVAQNNTEGGFYDYYWPNPSTGEDQLKSTYIIQIEGTDYYIAAGAYLY